MIQGLPHLSYAKRLRKLRLFSLQTRRYRGILTMCIKVCREDVKKMEPGFS